MSAFSRVAMIVCVCSLPAAAQDECSSAVPITQGFVSGSTIGATTSAVTGSCGGMGSEVWYVLRSPLAGNAYVSLCVPGTSADFDTVLAAFSGSCGALTEITCNDDTCGLTSEISFRARRGQTYYIAVGGFSGGQGNYTLHFSLRDAPRGDDCARPLPISEGLTAGSNVGASVGPITASCGLIASDIWYEYRPTCTGTATATFCASGGQASHDTVLAAFSGDCHTLQELACNDDTCDLQSEIAFSVQAGQRYLIVVGGFLGAQGSYTLSLECGADSPSAVAQWPVQEMRLGTPKNPPALVPNGKAPPIAGRTWSTRIKHGAFMPEAVGDFLLIAAEQPANVPSPFGTVLVALTPAPFAVHGTAGTPFAIAIPSDSSLVGAALSAQGGSFGTTAIRLTNALDVTIGAR